MVEFALAMPLLLLLVMAIIQFGIMLSDYSSLVDAARAGARALALGTSRTADPCDPAVAAAMNSTAGQFPIPSGDIVPKFPNPATAGEDYCGTSSTCNYVYATSCNTSGAEVAGDEAQITITYKYTLSLFGLGVLPINLTTTSTDAIE
jgi:Flp pilus assembly protein TadG